MPRSEASASAFISTARTKRKRVSRACDQCFLKKDRCDGLTPICTFCSQLQRTCTYDRPERKRGPTQGLRPRLEQRIAALETVLGFVLEQTGEEGLRVDLLQGAREEEKRRWRQDGWWESDMRKELEREFGLEEDLATSGSAVKGEEASPTAALEREHDDAGSESDYSEVDLSLPPTHKPSTDNKGQSSPRHSKNAVEHHIDDDAANLVPMPLLSSGAGGSSLNRGLVPRGTDPNTALGGFNIEFGGNQTDIDWVESFTAPAQSRNRRQASQGKGQRRQE
ncbi:Zn(2)-C6 fungal-type DNA-binding domain protein [Kalmanozyma brasiliensis GHG001]|uniref:Zn(2)-C6 fungal-type DNA-binding domain protein n=1 Tax=Kalmanozyma brasiliensis (strain GHG001) TaxID=1365824 RepID=UPI001CE7ED69|nr:Zn(2)-C6 fungal-type DNA-binding domain protein [Kalmanozyma brasiliensis GHG001]KAF6766871.1 Zn(2)-C6 fungal-type DNA-binding domain protein [Kalmanozyma brasiliensis GHG001]